MYRYLTVYLLFATCSITSAADEWTELFDGKSLDGWVRRGGDAKYHIEEGCIVGTSIMGTPNTFLCTSRDYSDFILEYEFKIDPELNSGVQIRSRSLPTASDFDFGGNKIQIPADLVHGYQIEIDPNPEDDSCRMAGIYDEARRGWLYPGILGGNAKEFTEKGRRIFMQGGWNKVRVEAVGDTIKTTLNGMPRASIRDSVTASGFIALQVHRIEERNKEGTQVHWRNLKIQEVVEEGINTLTTDEKAAGWRLLWNGKNHEGWRSAKGPDFPKAGWKMENGLIIINETGGGESSAAGDIITVEKFSQFEFSVDFRITPGANSGIKTFVDPSMNNGEGSAIGPEFQILDDKHHPDAELGRDGNRTIGSLYDMKAAPADKKAKPIGEWNNARIFSEEKQLTYWLNGEKTIDIKRGSKEWRDLVAISKYKVWPNFGELEEGHILLQDHGNQVFYKNLKIRDFSKK